ncbi:MAG: helix-turn-helix domain-containing protein [Solirubrobacterales bacterium]
MAEQFGRNLRRWRLKRDLSGEQVSQLADIDRSAVWLIEKGKRLPDLETLIKLAGALGIEPDELLRGIGFRAAKGQRPAGLYIRGQRQS